MSHINVQETRAIVEVFPKVPKRLTEALIRAHAYVSANYKQVQERLIIRQLTEYELNLYRSTRDKIECPLSLFLYMGMKRPVGYCKTCGEITCFRYATGEFQEFCSNSCASPYTTVRRVKTWRKKYGSDNPTKTAAIRQKISNGVKSYMRSIGIEPVCKRKFSFQPPTVKFDTGSDFYVYVLLDPRIAGAFQYGKWKFANEPFYVGKGHGGRAFSHIKNFDANTHNVFKNNKIRKIMQETGKNPIVLLKRKNLSESEAFELEAKLIWNIGRKDKKLGPLTNHSDGGEGVSGRVWTKKQKVEQSERTKTYLSSLTAEQKYERGRKVAEANALSFASGTRKLSLTGVMYQQELDKLYGKKINTFKRPDATVHRCQKHRHKCLVCGSIWDTSPSYLLGRQYGCPECRKIDPVVIASKRQNRSTASRKARDVMTEDRKMQIAKKLSNAVKASWDHGALAARRL